MATYGIDYAWHGVLSPSVWYRDGLRFVCRYLSHDASKNLSLHEANLIAGAGLLVVTCWETASNRMGQGYSAGVVDAAAAYSQATACGKPAGAPIYFCCDYDAQWSDVENYIAGCYESMPHAEIGVYGGYRVVEGLYAHTTVRWYWQTRAWSGGKWSTHAQIQQYGATYTGGGVTADYDRAYIDNYGGWTPGGKSISPPGAGASAAGSAPGPPQEQTSWTWGGLVWNTAKAVANTHSPLDSAQAALDDLMSTYPMEV